MSKNKLDEIEKKKRELQAELDRIQDELDHSIDEVRTEVSSKLQPSEVVRRYPLPIVGASILIGFFVGHDFNRPRRSGTGHSEDSIFTSALWEEIKKLASKKAISFASEYVESLLEDKREHPVSMTNGSVDTED